MPDRYSAAERSRIMGLVRTRRTGPEEALASALRSLQVRVRRNVRAIEGVPDFRLVGTRLVVFVDGDFWHGRDWFTRGVAPVRNRQFWIQKFERNRHRDRQVDANLRARGWRVVRLWASQVLARPEATALRVARLASRNTGSQSQPAPQPVASPIKKTKRVR